MLRILILYMYKHDWQCYLSHVKWCDLSSKREKKIVENIGFRKLTIEVTLKLLNKGY